MIYSESKKLHLIASLINEEDGDVLKKVEEILAKSADRPFSKFANFSNTLSTEELDEFERNIEEGFEQVKNAYALFTRP